MENLDRYIQEAMRLAGTPQGQQLIRALQSKADPELKQALDRSGNGDMAQAKALLQKFLSDPENKRLLEQLGR